MYIADNILLHHFVSNKSQITTVNHPFPRTKFDQVDMQQENSIIHNYMVMFYMLIGFAVFMGASTLYVIRYVTPFDNKHHGITHIYNVDNKASKQREEVNLSKYL